MPTRSDCDWIRFHSIQSENSIRLAKKKGKTHTHTQITIQIDTPHIVHTRTLYNTHHTTHTTAAAFLIGSPSTLSQPSTLNSRAKHTHLYSRQYPTTTTTSSLNFSSHSQEDKKEETMTHTDITRKQ